MSVQVYILSRDRPAYFRETLESVLAQRLPGMEIVVSDNSEGDAVQELVATSFPDVRYIRRRPALPALDHFRTVIEESSAELVVFFHDDDVMGPAYIQTMAEALGRNPDAAAVGCNAFVLQCEERSATRLMGSFAQVQRIENPEQLLMPYMAFMGMRPAPFPGYMYRRRFLDGLYLDPAHGGKYADVSFLVKLVSRAPIIWLPEPLMWYRVHGANDSVKVSVGQLLSLLRFIYTHTSVSRDSSMVAEYRFRYWVRWWRNYRRGAERHMPWRSGIVTRYLLATGLKWAFRRPGLWLRFLAQVR